METTNESPGAGGATRGGCGADLSGSDQRQPSSRAAKIEALTVRVLPDGKPTTVRGRMAQTLALLIERGPKGFTSGEASPLGWARRTSHYVYKLRAAGFPVVTVREPMGDALVGRYTLASPVAVVEVEPFR